MHGRDNLLILVYNKRKKELQKVKMFSSPFNYTGSKSKLTNQLMNYLPENHKQLYCYDLFCGGGGFFINTMSEFKGLIVNDIITPLIQFYQWLQDTEWDIVISVIRSTNISKDDQQGYLDLRKRFNDEKNFIDFFMLVCCCTNNMMRFNKSYGFNQTWGKRNFNQSTENKLRAYHAKIFENPCIHFLNKSFIDFIDIETGPKSFVYLDPPYLITEAGYNAYWSQELENKLYLYINELNKNGIPFMLSNVQRHKGKKNTCISNLLQYNIIELNFDYKKVSRDKNNQDSQEVIVINYEPPLKQNKMDWMND